MKFTLLACVAATLASLSMAAPRPFDGNAKCEVQGFKINYSKVTDCCLKNVGGSNFKDSTVYCTLPIGKEGYFRKCVKDLGYATSVDCEYYKN
jgi:hypothetical protein